jgi:putative ABC transport system ATP-binding protein
LLISPCHRIGTALDRSTKDVFNEARNCSEVNRLFELTGVRYKNILAIEHLVIESGKTTCIVGESGSGKTTLLKLLNNMINYNEGSITFHGADLKKLDPVEHRRKVIMLPQTPVIFPGSIKDNLLIGLKFAGKNTVTDERLLEELDRVGLLKKLDEEAEKLSGGEKQRLALARVILMEPSVLLLDEPTSALDEGSEENITAYINDYLAGADKTLVMVTHSGQLAQQMADTIVTVCCGEVTASEEAAGV